MDFNIFTDSKWACYVLEQIINNACKYVDVCGKIEISAIENDESIILSIRDNGMGIPAKDIDRILIEDLQGGSMEEKQGNPQVWGGFIFVKRLQIS